MVSAYNFSSIRYSLPMFFTAYGILFFIVLLSIKNKALSLKLTDYVLYAYYALSVPFLVISEGYVHQGRFAGFVGSPTIYAGYITLLFVISSLRLKITSLKYICLYVLTFGLVYITKTRLLLVFLILFPILRELVSRKLWLTKKRLFLIFYGITFSIYPLYVLIYNWLPVLVALRYGKKEDTSFGLRNYLFISSKDEFFRGTTSELLFGKGNEYSRNFVYELMKIDYMPHNDYLRLLIDWGVLGFILFSVFLYKIAIKNVYTLFIALTYMVLFYSNMIFNLFLFSLLIIFYFKPEKQL